MLRWCLPTVRALGRHDTNARRVFLRVYSLCHLTIPRFSRIFSPQTLRLSRSRFSRAHADAAVPVANLVEVPDAPLVASSSAQSHPTAYPLSLRSAANPPEDRDPCRATRSRTSYSAIDTLRWYLSPENVASDRPHIYSPTTIRSLYYRAESRNQLGMLDSKMLTLLIGLFGSLSIDPCISVVYRVPLASRFSEVSTRRTHWAFVLKVGKHKLERGMPLQDSDRFWLMRAELAIVQAGPPSERKFLLP